ncbi:MAG TPA: hypothetical protein VFP81_03350 [Propionibacteriaceae bacterium]|nr:hypothetical protein [Propionibacteriaceae bacterium]
MESVTPAFLTRLRDRFTRLTHDQRDRVVTVDGNEMVDGRACTLSRIRTYGGVIGKRRGGVDQHGAPARKSGGAEIGGVRTVEMIRPSRRRSARSLTIRRREDHLPVPNHRLCVLTGKKPPESLTEANNQVNQLFG